MTTPNRPSSRGYQAVIAAVLLMAAMVLFFCMRYDRDCLYVSKVLLRAVVLKSMEVGTGLYDPFAPEKVVSLGPAGLPTVLPETSHEFAKLVKSLYPSSSITITGYDNRPMQRSRYPFGYQTVAESRIASLKVKYDFPKPVAANRDFDAIVALSNWVHSQLRHGTSGAAKFHPDKFDADIILKSAKQGDTFWCHVYAMTFIQLVSSVGIQARLLSLSHDGYTPEHAVAEVWSREKQKWFLVDPNFNIWYSADGVPLNALEVHERVLAGQTSAIRVMKGVDPPYPDFERRIPELYKYYRYFEVDLRNDWLSNRYFPGHPARSERATLFWNDTRLPTVLNLKTKVSTARDLYWDLNLTELHFKRDAAIKRQVDVEMATHTPDFSHFEVVFDGLETRWVTSGRLVWLLHPGKNSLKVRSVNSLGQKGSLSQVVVEIASP